MDALPRKKRRQLPERLFDVTLLSIEQARQVANVDRATLEDWIKNDPKVKLVPVGKKEQRVPYGELVKLIARRMHSEEENVERILQHIRHAG